MAIDDVTGDEVQLIDAGSARQLRAAAMTASDVPVAKMEAISLEFFVLEPEERAIVPVQWSKPPGVSDELLYASGSTGRA